jgi:5-methylcytosine-specific restriction protein B
MARALDMLKRKRQLVIHGAHGTGKSYVAQQLALGLTNNQDDCVKWVEFHPAYGYEEFVEGIKARTVEVNGRHEVTYPVEDGLLTSFAGEAARRPAEPFVLVIDEINRGNLPAAGEPLPGRHHERRRPLAGAGRTGAATALLVPGDTHP